MSSWKPWFARGLRHLVDTGWAGIIGLTLLCTAASFSFSGNATLKANLADVAHQRQVLSEAARSPSSATVQSPRALFTQFQQQFPPASSLPDVLMQLHNQAKALGLAPQRADYSETAEAGTALHRIRIGIPLKGRYPALREWLERSLRDQPALSIDALEIHRSSSAQDQLDAQVRLIFFVKAGP